MIDCLKQGDGSNACLCRFITGNCCFEKRCDVSFQPFVPAHALALSTSPVNGVCQVPVAALADVRVVHDLLSLRTFVISNYLAISESRSFCYAHKNCAVFPSFN